MVTSGPADWTHYPHQRPGKSIPNSFAKVRTSFRGSHANVPVEQEARSRKRGPKPLTVPQRIAVTLWATTIERQIRAAAPPPEPRRRPRLSPYEVERALHQGTRHWQAGPEGVRRPKQFDYFIEGEHWPTARTVAQYDVQCPDATHWLTLDLWPLIEVEPPPLEHLHSIMRKARESIRSRLFERVAPDDPLNASWRRKSATPNTVADAIRAEGDMEALTVLVALLREAEIQSDSDGHAVMARRVVNLVFALGALMPWLRHAANVFRYMRKEVFNRMPSTVDVLDLANVDPDAGVSLYMNMYESAMSAGLIDEACPRTAIKEMLLLEQIGPKAYMDHLAKECRTGRIIVIPGGLSTEYPYD